jgi:hypothetical protein
MLRGKRIGLLENHADAAAEFDASTSGLWISMPIDPDAARDARAGDEIVHAVETAQQGGLAAAGGADEGGDLVARISMLMFFSATDLP